LVWSFYFSQHTVPYQNTDTPMTYGTTTAMISFMVSL
jgi:hypothetical protein